MKRIAMLRWFGAGALGLSLVAGCSHSRSASVRNSTSTPVACANCGCPSGQCQGTAVAGGPSAPPSVARNVPMYTSAASVPAPSYGTVPTPTMYSGVIQASAPAAPPAGPEVQPAGLKSTFTRGEPAPTRKSYVDITAASCFSHTPDYGTICGQLEQSRATNTWRLRYLSVDEADGFGGSVTLIGDSTQLSTLKDGHQVKVQGHLNNPDQNGIAPAYRVESVEPINTAN